MTVQGVVLIGIVTVGILIGLTRYIYLLRKKVHRLNEDRENLLELHQKEKEEVRRDAKKRSGAVTWGKAIEHFVPFMEEFPVPPEDCVFIGMPIDYVAFKDTGSKTKCEVHFVEIKSGNAFMLAKQKNIKTAIEEGRVYFHEIGVEGNTIKEKVVKHKKS